MYVRQTFYLFIFCLTEFHFLFCFCNRKMSTTSKLFKVTFTPATLLAATLLGTFCVCADHFINIPQVNSVYILGVLADNLTHGIVGLWSWAIAKYKLGQSVKQYVMEVMVCGIAASAVDVDHFIAAQSFYMKVKFIHFFLYPFFMPSSQSSSKVTGHCHK